MVNWIQFSFDLATAGSIFITGAASAALFLRRSQESERSEIQRLKITRTSDILSGLREKCEELKIYTELQFVKIIRIRKTLEEQNITVEEKIDLDDKQLVLKQDISNAIWKTYKILENNTHDIMLIMDKPFSEKYKEILKDINNVRTISNSDFDSFVNQSLLLAKILEVELSRAAWNLYNSDKGTETLFSSVCNAVKRCFKNKASGANENENSYILIKQEIVGSHTHPDYSNIVNKYLLE